MMSESNVMRCGSYLILESDAGGQDICQCIRGAEHESKHVGNAIGGGRSWWSWDKWARDFGPQPKGKRP